MINERFPNWDVDIENGTIYSLKYKKYIGIIDKCGYIRVNKDYLHRIIWMVANECDIPEGYDIHHIDGNKLNNNFKNLELIGHSEHNKHKKKKVGKYSLDGELLKTYQGGIDTKQDGFSPSKVGECCQGLLEKYKGFIWRFI